MVKRPLCLFVLLFMAALWMAGRWGPSREEAPDTFSEAVLAPYLRGEKQATIYGEVQRWEDYDTAQYLYLKNAILPDSGEQIPLQGVRVKSEERKTWSPGNMVCAQGFLVLPEEADNPGQFDRRSYDGLRGVFYVLEEAQATLVRDTRDEGACALLAVKSWLGQGISRAAPQEAAGVLRAMLLGEKGEASQEIKLLYQLSSMSHLLAISGLHISLLGEGTRKLLQLLGVGVYGAYAGAFLLLVPYALLVGGSVSALRAVILFGMGAGARFLGRTYDLLSALALAAFLILLQEPGWLYDSSFLLSFGAVLGITLVRSCLFPADSGEKKNSSGRKQGSQGQSCRLKTGRGGQAVRRLGTKIRAGLCRQLSQGLGAGTALWLTTLPVVLYFFYEVSLYGILVNLLVIPTAGLVLGFGLLGGLLAGVEALAWLGRLVALPSVFLLELYEQIARLVSRLPYPTLILGRPGWGAILGYYGILLALCIWRKRAAARGAKAASHREKTAARETKTAARETKAAAHGEKAAIREKGAARPLGGAAQLLLLGTALALFLVRPGEGVKVTMLDVGQGDGLVITTGWGSCYLVDGGSSSVYQAGRYRLLPYLKYQGIQMVDLCIMTHPDGDHVNGLLELLQMIARRETSLRIEGILLPGWMEGSQEEQELCLAAREAGAFIHYARAGDQITDGELSLEILHPDQGDYRQDTNGGSLSFLLEYRGRRGLFTGDLTGEQEEKLLSRLQSCDFLKVAHHGSASSTGEALLQAVRPLLALISSGEDNAYGHPSPETLRRLEKAGSRCLGTQELGAIELHLDSDGLQVNWMHPEGKI